MASSLGLRRIAVVVVGLALVALGAAAAYYLTRPRDPVPVVVQGPEPPPPAPSSPSTPEAWAKAPSPLDRLKPEEVPLEQRALAGGGDPTRAPPELGGRAGAEEHRPGVAAGEGPGEPRRRFGEPGAPAQGRGGGPAFSGRQHPRLPG